MIQSKPLCPCRNLAVEDVVSAASVNTRERTSRNSFQDRELNSTVDRIVHFRPVKQISRGGLLNTNPPDWLSRLNISVKLWLQHWLKPKHLKGISDTSWGPVMLSAKR